MEILNKKIVVLLVFCNFFFGLIAQSDNAVREAIKKSYDSEYQLKYQKAIEDLMGVYEPTSYELNLRIGWLNYKAGKYTESINYYKKAITKMPLSIEAKLGIVYPLGALEKWEQVVDNYLAIVKIDAFNAIANYRLALIYYNRGDYGNSWKFLQKYINLYPFDYDGNSLAVWVKYSVGKKEEAYVFFKKALMVNPYDTSFNKVLGIR